MSQHLRSVNSTGTEIRLGPRRKLSTAMREYVYGLDIETDTTVDGLDPAVARIVAVGVSTPTADHVFDGAEPQLLEDLDAFLAELPAGVLVTWNGSAFDLPFLHDRAEHCGVPLGLLLCEDPSIARRSAPIGDHRHAYRGSWYHHSHLDAYRLYRGDVGPALRVSCALKSIARLVGLPAVEADVTRLHELAPAEVATYVLSDARLARQLVLRRWASARRFADPRPFVGTSAPQPEPGAPGVTGHRGPTGVVATSPRVAPEVEENEVAESVRVLRPPARDEAAAG